jgi:hypothetical protein
MGLFRYMTAYRVAHQARAANGNIIYYRVLSGNVSDSQGQSSGNNSDGFGRVQLSISGVKSAQMTIGAD